MRSGGGGECSRETLLDSQLVGSSVRRTELEGGPGIRWYPTRPFETGTEAGYIWFGSWGRVYPGRVSTSGPRVWGSGYCQVVDLVSYWSDAPITTQPLNLFIYLQIFTGLVSIPSLEAYPAHLHFHPHAHPGGSSFLIKVGFVHMFPCRRRKRSYG